MATEQARIQSERKQIQSRAAADEASCYQRFAVNECLQNVRATRRAALLDLRRQEVSLNEAERKSRGAAQVRRTEERLAARSDAVEAATPRVVPQPRPPLAKPRATDRRTASVLPGPAATPGAGAPAQAARSARPRKGQPDPAEAGATYEQKQREAAERRAKRDARTANRKKPISAPLPAAD